MVSRLQCLRFAEMVENVSGSGYTFAPEPSSSKGYCHVGLVNKKIKTYGGISISSDGSIQFDVPQTGGGKGGPRVKRLLKDLLDCGCKESWVHDYTVIGGVSNPSYHIHGNCPPQARRCAVKKVLEEP